MHQPFVTSQGTATSARAIAVTLTTSDGLIGRGESVPVQYVTGETVESVLAEMERVAPRLQGAEVPPAEAMFSRLVALLPESPSARCGMEMALLDLLAQRTGVSLAQSLGGERDGGESDRTIPIAPNAAELAAQAWVQGVRVFKLKVGGEVAAELARVHAIRAAVPEARLRIDANQAFTPEGAINFIERLLAENARVELLEQPVPKEDFAGMGWVAERSPIPVFADETVRTPDHARRLLAETPVQGVNLKINKNGIGGVLEIIRLAQNAGRKLMLGCMLETRRSIAVSLEIACGTGVFDFLDLDSHHLLNEPGNNPYFHEEGAFMRLH